MQFGCDLYFWSRYGNGASIFTTSGAAARKFQTEIEAGQVRKSFGHILDHAYESKIIGVVEISVNHKLHGKYLLICDGLIK